MKKIDWPIFSHGAAACFNCGSALDGIPRRWLAVSNHAPPRLNI